MYASLIQTLNPYFETAPVSAEPPLQKLDLSSTYELMLLIEGCLCRLCTEAIEQQKEQAKSGDDKMKAWMNCCWVVTFFLFYCM